MVFLVLLVMMLVAGFQVLGTLMVVGIMMLPATAARFWVRAVGQQMILAGVIGTVSSYVGLLLSYHANVPARSEEHTSELQSLMRISYAVFCLKKKNTTSTKLISEAYTIIAQ